MPSEIEIFVSAEEEIVSDIVWDTGNVCSIYCGQTSYVLEFNITLDEKCKLICNMFSDAKNCAANLSQLHRQLEQNTRYFLFYKILLEIFRLTVLSAVSLAAFSDLNNWFSLMALALWFLVLENYDRGVYYYRVMNECRGFPYLF